MHCVSCGSYMYALKCHSPVSCTPVFTNSTVSDGYLARGASIEIGARCSSLIVFRGCSGNAPLALLSLHSGGLSLCADFGAALFHIFMVVVHVLLHRCVNLRTLMLVCHGMKQVRLYPGVLPLSLDSCPSLFLPHRRGLVASRLSLALALERNIMTRR